MTRITVPKTATIPISNGGRSSVIFSPVLFAKAVEEIMAEVPAEVFESISINLTPIYDSNRLSRYDDLWNISSSVKISLTRDMTEEEKTAEREIELARIRFDDLTKKGVQVIPQQTIGDTTPQKPSFFKSFSWTGR